VLVVIEEAEGEKRVAEKNCPEVIAGNSAPEPVATVMVVEPDPLAGTEEPSVVVALFENCSRLIRGSPSTGFERAILAHQS
jgi:hypothetical protein